MLDKLKGYRTYLSVAAVIIVTILKSLGHIDESTYQNLVALFGGAGLAFLRAAVDPDMTGKIDPKMVSK